MLKLNTPITIGDDTFTHMIFVRGEHDVRLPVADLYPCLVRLIDDHLYLGRVLVTETGTLAQMTELLTTVRIAPTPDTDPALTRALQRAFFDYLERLEQIAVALQSDPERNPFKTYQLGLTTYSLACTYEPMGAKEVGLEVKHIRTPQELTIPALEKKE